MCDTSEFYIQFCFVVFSHRPLCVENIYNAVQTKIVLKQENTDSDIPEYEEIFRDDEVW